MRTNNIPHPPNPRPHANFHFSVVNRQKLIIYKGLESWEYQIHVRMDLLYNMVASNPQKANLSISKKKLLPMSYIAFIHWSTIDSKINENQAAKPEFHNFENRFKSCFDPARL